MAFVKNKKKRLISLIISTAVSIATIIVTYLSIPIAKPIVLPLDGMLTEDYPFVEFKYPNCLNHFFPKKDFWTGLQQQEPFSHSIEIIVHDFCL